MQSDNTLHFDDERITVGSKHRGADFIGDDNRPLTIGSFARVWLDPRLLFRHEKGIPCPIRCLMVFLIIMFQILPIVIGAAVGNSWQQLFGWSIVLCSALTLTPFIVSMTDDHYYRLNLVETAEVAVVESLNAGADTVDRKLDEGKTAAVTVGTAAAIDARGDAFAGAAAANTVVRDVQEGVRQARSRLQVRERVLYTASRVTFMVCSRSHTSCH